MLEHQLSSFWREIMPISTELAMSDARHADAWLASGLAFVGGYGDAISFLLAKTFTGHITGSWY